MNREKLSPSVDFMLTHILGKNRVRPFSSPAASKDYRKLLY